MKSIRNGLVALALGASLGLAGQAAGFFHDNYKRLELKRIENSIVERCKGDFYVFEELQPEPIEPFVAVLNANDFKEGILEGGVKVRIEKNKRLEDYLNMLKRVNNEHNYGLIEENIDGRYICGVQHLKPSIYVDKEKRIDVKGTTKDGGGGGSGGGASGGDGGGGTCLLCGNKVMLSNGKKINIENIKVNDKVVAVDIDSNKTILTKVTKLITNHPRDHYFIINGSISITNDHPVLVFRENKWAWIRIEDLRLGNKVKSRDGFNIVRSIIKINTLVPTVYMETECGNFLVDNDGENYIVKSDYALLENTQSVSLTN